MLSASKIGQCAICLSHLTSTNTFVITKCGHTFHQECIYQWIKERKNCPSCRTMASKSDVIKLYIQECDIETEMETDKDVDSLCIKERIMGYNHLLMKKCKCELFQYDNGDLQYHCVKNFNVNIKYEKSNGILKIIFSSGYTVTIYKDMQLEILHEKTNKRIGVTADGFINGKDIFRVQQFDVPYTGQSDKEYAIHFGDRIKFFYPGFTVSRSLKNEYENFGVIVKMLSTTDPNDTILNYSRQKGFRVKHLDNQPCCDLLKKFLSMF